MKVEKTLRYITRCRQRQPDSAWTRDYEPAIRATRGEAPARSRFFVVNAVAPLNRRVHLLSSNEFAWTLLSMYHQDFIDLHEQKVLQPFESAHPLQHHPRCSGLSLGRLPGMVACYEALGELRRYPTTRVRGEDGSTTIYPTLLVGDLLVYLKTPQAARCVNLSVKAEPADFYERSKRKQNDGPTLAIRHRSEAAQYAAVGIPTRQVAGSALPVVLVRNLEDVYTEFGRFQPAYGDVADQIEVLLAAEMFRTPLLELERFVWAKFGLTRPVFRCIAYTLIWQHRIAVDLYSRLLWDAPLPPPTGRLDALVKQTFAEGE